MSHQHHIVTSTNFIPMAASPYTALAPSRAANALSSTLHTSIGHSLLRIWQDQLGPPLFSQGLRPRRRSPATAVRREGATYSRGS